MAFQAGLDLQEHYSEAKALARQAKNTCNSYLAAFLGGGSGTQLVELQQKLGKIYVQLQAKTSVPGLGQYAKDQRNDQTYNITAEFTAMLNALDNVLVELRTAMPQDGNNYLLILKMVNDVPEWRTFNAGALSSIRLLLQAAADTINF